MSHAIPETIPADRPWFETSIECADCHFWFQPIENGQTKYAIHNNRKVCLKCAASRQTTAMIVDGKATLYLNDKHDEVTDFPGVLRFPIARIQPLRHPLHRSAWLVYFKGPDGRNWSGRNVGDNNLLHVRRLKGAPPR